MTEYEFLAEEHDRMRLHISCGFSPPSEQTISENIQLKTPAADRDSCVQTALMQ